jgi:cell division protein ZapB
VAVIVEEGQRAGRAGTEIGSILSSCTLTHSEYRFYSLAMPRDDFLAASDLDLRSLEARVNDLIRTCNTLKAENNSLRSRQDQLVAERAALIEKTEMARNRVEAMIQRLKSLETGA